MLSRVIMSSLSWRRLRLCPAKNCVTAVAAVCHRNVRFVVQLSSTSVTNCFLVGSHGSPARSPAAYSYAEHLVRSVFRPRLFFVRPPLYVGYPHNGPITIAIRARFEYDSTTIRLQHAARCVRFEYDTTSYEELCAFEQ